MEWFTNQTNWIVSIHSFSSEEIGGESGDWGDPQTKKIFCKCSTSLFLPVKCTLSLIFKCPINSSIPLYSYKNQSKNIFS